MTYVDLVRQFRIEGEPISPRTYDDLRTAGALMDAINQRNSQDEQVKLPPPANPSQTQPFASLLRRAERARDLSGFNPEFIKGWGTSPLESFNEYLSPVEQADAVTAWADCWDALPSDRQYDNSEPDNLPPASRKWSRSERGCKRHAPRPAGKGESVKLPARPQAVDATVRAATAKRNEKEAAEFKKMMADIRERREDISARNEQERIAAEIRRKQAEEQDEIKGYVREYSFAINEVLRVLPRSC